jgi:hypothetical protein
VAIFLSLRFLPQGTSTSPCLKIKKAAKAATKLFEQYETGKKKGQYHALPFVKD